jgi:hypothetical protein
MFIYKIITEICLMYPSVYGAFRHPVKREKAFLGKKTEEGVRETFKSFPNVMCNQLSVLEFRDKRYLKDL